MVDFLSWEDNLKGLGIVSLIYLLTFFVRKETLLRKILLTSLRVMIILSILFSIHFIYLVSLYPRYTGCGHLFGIVFSMVEICLNLTVVSFISLRQNRHSFHNWLLKLSIFNCLSIFFLLMWGANFYSCKGISISDKFIIIGYFVFSVVLTVFLIKKILPKLY
ncbi:hypothetical protein DHW03_02190 [Pedobacter yonginense]|uniref:Uncharacterized protein n=1 Tax=Pedobacter yonginense TaxID=651869 RepID=A0A317EU35_9SPHI|nr:hypothetical protein DHW03_02190 [Pedobacter yonginense]